MLANKNQFTKDFMRKMTQSSAASADNFNKIMDSLASIGSTLDNIDSNLQQVATTHTFNSQSAARDSRDFASSNDRPFGQHHANFTKDNSRYNDESNIPEGQRRRSGRRSPFDDLFTERDKKDFADRLEKSIEDAFGGDVLRSSLKDFIKEFSKKISKDSGKSDVLGQIQDVLIKTVSNTIKETGPAKAVRSLIEKFTGQVFSKENAEGLGDLLKNLQADDSATLSTVFEGLKGLDFGELGNTIVSGGSKLVSTFTELTSTVGGSVATLGAGLLVIKAAELVVKQVNAGLEEMKEGLQEVNKSLTSSSKRYYESSKKNIELANERLRADVKTLIEEPFNILKKAADEVYSAWSSNARLIGGTQGYRKEDLQDLMSAYAKRLESEGLNKVVSSTDIYNNLAKVIESGLTGTAAVEFAYQATRLNAAVPNQDFFSYVESYASVAANAIAAGKSESEALQIANQSLEEFSNSLLYASRGLTGGYGTSLKSAQTTYEAAVKISQAAKSSNINNIASSLLAIQGYVGSIAPDLASSLTEKIYQLAVGGNAEDIVALRSLAGINASNTEFLRAFSANPQSVLSNMFANLGMMFSQSSDAYMEKAESYASLFGISAEALQRIDFNSLASAIKQMNSNSDALDQNIQLLKEGQTTTSADQLKIEQINKYMIEEGLAYVIDNEAAQMIQEHMWDEQIARDLMEAEYGVNIVGSVASAITKIASGVDTIISILNPIAWFTKTAELVKTVDEASDIQADITSVLKAGVVGSGSRSDLYNLTTRNKDLNLTRSLVELLGGESRYGNSWYNKIANSTFGKLFGYTAGALSHPLSSTVDFYRDLGGQLSSAVSWGSDYLKSAGKNYLHGYVSLFSGDLKGVASDLKNSLSDLGSAILGGDVNKAVSNIGSALSSWITGGTSSKLGMYLPTSQYSWGTISKSSAAVSSALLSQTTGNVSTGIVSNIVNAISSSVSVVKDKLSKWLSGETITEDFIKQGKTYKQWRDVVAAQGIADVDQALKDAGYDPEAVESYYQAKQAEAGMAEKAEDRAEQKAYYQTSTQFMNSRFWDEYSTPAKTSLTSITSKLDSIIELQSSWKESQITQLQSIALNQVDWKEYFESSWIGTVWKTEFTGESGLFTRFFNEFVNKFVQHTYYDASGYKYSDVTEIQRREDAEKGSAVYALADALTGNLVDLKDPQVQTNAILAQILVVVSAIMNQNNNVASTVSLSDALSGLALGLTSSTPMNETPVTT